MSIESGDNLGSGFPPRQAGRELRMAAFADAQEVWGRFNDAELSGLHDPSLPLMRGPVDFKRHHYLLAAFFAKGRNKGRLVRGLRGL